MELQDFYDSKSDVDMNPIEWFSANKTIESVLTKCDVEISEGLLYFQKKEIGQVLDNKLIPGPKCNFSKGKKIITLQENKPYTSFMLYSLIYFKNNFVAAMNNIIRKEFRINLPFIRVGVDYYKVIKKKDRWGIERVELKAWKKEELKLDYGSNAAENVSKYDDFTLEPDNSEYSSIVDNCYNLYRPFVWQPSTNEISAENIPYSIQVMRHIFQEQIEAGLDFMKILYEMPKERFYILCLVSTKRGTGKSTFLNWLDIIFGDNYVNTNIEELQSQFNGSYCAKNIIAIEEALSDKKAIMEKLKALSLMVKVPVNEKYIRNYSIPFYAKFIFASNHELDFIKIDDEEDRFWIRKIPPLPQEYKDERILEYLQSEVPKFLKYLQQRPTLKKEYRFMIPPERIMTEATRLVKLQSKNGLYKDMVERFKMIFWQNEGLQYFYCSPTDIQEKFYEKIKSQISIGYISETLRKEFKLSPVPKAMRYHRFDEAVGNLNAAKTPGKPYLIERAEFLNEDDEIEEMQEKLPF
jgi:hypothetical protein